MTVFNDTGAHIMYEHQPVPQGSLSHELMNYTVELTIPPGAYKVSVKAGSPFGCSEHSDMFMCTCLELKVD